MKVGFVKLFWMCNMEKVKFNKSERAEISKRVRERTKVRFSKFHGEMRKSVLVAIVAAFSFLIALSWKELISEWVGFLTVISPVQGKVVEVLVVTIISVVGILLVTYYLGDK